MNIGTIGRIALLMASMTLAAAGSAQVSPPWWWGQQLSSSAYGCFEFDNASNPYGWTANSYWSYGTPTVSPIGATQWDPGTTAHPGLVGVGPGQTGGLTMYFENDFDFNKVKDIWFQVVFYEHNPDSDVSADLFAFPVGQVTFNEVDTPLGGGWTMATCTASVYPQPDWERLDFTFLGGAVGTNDSAWLDSVCFGTFCHPVPEPAGLLALGLGIAVLFGRRANRRTFRNHG